MGNVSIWMARTNVSVMMASVSRQMALPASVSVTHVPFHFFFSVRFLQNSSLVFNVYFIEERPHSVTHLSIFFLQLVCHTGFS